MSKLYRPDSDRMMRRKVDTDDDPDYRTNQWDPGTFTGTVASAAAGTLTVQITPVDADRYPTPEPIEVTLTAETEAEAAEAVADAVNSHLSSVDDNADYDPALGRYLLRAEYTAAAEAARFVPNPAAPRFTVSLSASGGATFTLSPDDTFPITHSLGKPQGPNDVARGEAVFSVYSVSSSDEVLGIGTCTFDVEVLRVSDRWLAHQQRELRPGVTTLGTLTGLELGEEFRVPVGHGRIGLRITNIANTPAGHDALWVEEHEAVT